jgi:hypothetical protein
MGNGPAGLEAAAAQLDHSGEFAQAEVPGTMDAEFLVDQVATGVESSLVLLAHDTHLAALARRLEGRRHGIGLAGALQAGVGP